jgi:hypothetical protein
MSSLSNVIYSNTHKQIYRTFIWRFNTNIPKIYSIFQRLWAAYSVLLIESGNHNCHLLFVKLFLTRLNLFPRRHLSRYKVSS